MSRSHLRQLRLSAVVEECIREGGRFRTGQPGDEGHCLELFCRAIEDSDQGASSAIHDQYYSLAARWIGEHQESEDLIQSAFAKFWRTLNGVRPSRRFTHIGAALAYLRGCALSVRFDLERRTRYKEREIAPEEWIVSRANVRDGPVLDSIVHEELRTCVRRYPEQFADARAARRIKQLRRADELRMLPES